MLIMAIEDARPGIKLAMAVMNPEQPKQELLRAGFCLDDSVIERLRSIGVTQIFVDFPGLDDLDKFIEPFLGPERKQIYATVKTAIAIAERDGQPVASFDAYATATRDFISVLMTRPENRALVDLINARGDGSEDVAHATTVAHLALVIGLRMETYLIRERPRMRVEQARDVVNLGVAGMLHDVGKCKLRPELRTHSILSPLENADAQSEWEAHTRVATT